MKQNKEIKVVTKIRLIMIVLLVGMLGFTACGKKEPEDVTEIMRSRIELSKKEGADNVNNYVLTMPDYGKILEEFDGKGDIEKFIITSIDDENYPVVTVEIPSSDAEIIDLNSPEVKKAVEDEFTKVINMLLEAEKE